MRVTFEHDDQFYYWAQGDLGPDGYALAKGVIASTACDQICELLDQVQFDSAGSRRMLDQPWCAALASQLKHHHQLRRLLPQDPVAVQCTLFEKSEHKNWLVALHQDLSVCVATRITTHGWGGWSEKEGLTFAHPPCRVLADLVAVRVHLDDCPISAGALRVVPQSHRAGKLEPTRLQDCHAIHLPAKRGDALLMRPLLLHASSRASVPARRRVLHFLYASGQGPEPSQSDLRWRWAV